MSLCTQRLAAWMAEVSRARERCSASLCALRRVKKRTLHEMASMHGERKSSKRPKTSHWKTKRTATLKSKRRRREKVCLKLHHANMQNKSM